MIIIGIVYYNPTSLIIMMVWTASARYYHPISLLSMMVWTASARYNHIYFPLIHALTAISPDMDFSQ